MEHLDKIPAFAIIIAGVSLFITVLNQVAAAIIGLRGIHLRWGIVTLIENVEPDLKEHAEEIAEKVLRHPLISDSPFFGSSRRAESRWKLAVAIRKGEFLTILRLLAERAPGQAKGAAAPSWQTQLRAALAKDPKIVADATQFIGEARKLDPNDAARTERIVTSIVNAPGSLTGRIEQWFDSVMDRSTYRFGQHMRLLTISFSVVIAFLMQLDAFELFERLSSDGDVRTKIMSIAESVTAKVPPAEVLGQAMKELISRNRGLIGLAEPPYRFNTLGEAETWLETQMRLHPGAEPAGYWIQRYEDLVPQAPTLLAVEELNAIIKKRFVFQLIPSPYPTPIFRDWTPHHRAFWGILASAVLLSLGAPLWFNLLKVLCNLRPILAKKTEEEPAS